MVEIRLTLKGRDIPFVNRIKYFGVIFDRKITWRLYVKTITAKSVITFLRVYFTFKSERLSTNIKLTLRKAVISTALTYACPGLGV